MTIDGKLIPVEEAEIWAETTATGQYSLFIRIKGGGYPSGSDIHVLAVREGLGCEIGGNELWLRPEGDEQFATHKPSCGLNISRLPRTAVGRFVGSFNGSVDAINGAPRSLSLGVTFDVPRRP